MKKWCGPLELILSRSISPAELLLISKRRNHLRMHLFLAATAIPLCFFVVPFFLFSKQGIWPTWLIASLSILVLLVGTSVAVLRFKEILFDLRSLRRGIRAGLVEEYSGLLQESEPYLGDLAPLVKRRFLLLGDPVSQRLAILPDSGLVLAAGDRKLLGKRFYVAPKHLSSLQNEPYSVEIDIRSMISSAKLGGKLSRRHLTEEERSEIERRTRDLSGVISWWRGFLLIMVLLVAVRWADLGSYAFLSRYSFALFILALFLLPEAYILYSRLIASNRLRRDLVEGGMFLLEAESLEGGNPRLEILANSQIVWTINQRPAGWRLDS